MIVASVGVAREGGENVVALAGLGLAHGESRSGVRVAGAFVKQVHTRTIPVPSDE